MGENRIKSRKFILEILKKYELGDAYLILQGLDLLGYENMHFWLTVVDFVKKYKGIESLVAYIDVMQLIGRDRLLFFMKEINSKALDFKESYEKFASLLLEVKKYSKDVFITKK